MCAVLQWANAPADAATVSGASAAADAAPIHEWRDIYKYCKGHSQRNVMNNYALKYFRWSYEDPAGVPSIPGEGRIFDLTQDTFPVYIARHEEKGPKYWFGESCGPEQPWSWRHLLGSLTKGPAEMFQPAPAVARDKSMDVSLDESGSSLASTADEEEGLSDSNSTVSTIDDRPPLAVHLKPRQRIVLQPAPAAAGRSSSRVIHTPRGSREDIGSFGVYQGNWGGRRKEVSLRNHIVEDIVLKCPAHILCAQEVDQEFIRVLQDPATGYKKSRRGWRRRMQPRSRRERRHSRTQYPGSSSTEKKALETRPASLL